MAEHVTMKARKWRFAIFCIALMTGMSTARGDGGMFIKRAYYADILQPTQKVYIRWDGSQEKLLIQTKYEGPAEEMVWIVPVPAKPTVEMGDAKVFNNLSIDTYDPDISYTDFEGLHAHWALSAGMAGPARGGASDPVEWRRRIGAYDVVLLRPVEEEDVIQWLNCNGFSVPDKAIPILEGYIRDQWWMVATRIHPDALTDITREKLANGLLNPLDMTFETSACLFPMRLTSIAAGPVEELIYIEGPTHYEPVTFADGKWEIEIFGGPIRFVPDSFRRLDVENAIEVAEGRTKTSLKRYITKLRRVFQPQEMTQDIIFGKMDYAKLLASTNPLQIAQGATQYGRHRDPNGVAHLLNALSPEVLEQMRPDPKDYIAWPTAGGRFQRWGGLYVHGISSKPVRSCIWALGEIGAGYGAGDIIEELLLHCAQHENQILRMEAYIALTKLGSPRLGPVLLDLLAEVPGDVLASTPDLWSIWGVNVMAELSIAMDWIVRFGTAEQKDALAKTLMDLIGGLPPDPHGYHMEVSELFDPPYTWQQLVIGQAAYTRDPQMIGPLQGFLANFPYGPAHPATLLVTRAQAACNSAEATATVVRQILDDEIKVLQEGGAGTQGDPMSLSQFYQYSGTESLHLKVLRRHWFRYELYPMPPEVSDAAFRTALSEKELSDWYTLYLLARIKEPQALDQERLMRVWDKNEPSMRVVVADVLYAWGNTPMLMDLYGRAGPGETASEIAWALADLSGPQAAAFIEEQVRNSWNAEWKATGKMFLRLPWDLRRYPVGPTMVDATRKVETLWHYFHPAMENLDSERSACLKRLAGDGPIHPGVRYELLLPDYALTDWGKPLFEKAAKEVLEADPSSTIVNRIAADAGAASVVDLCAEATSDEFRRNLLNELLGSGWGSLAVVEGLLSEVWPQRYIETEGQSLLFREAGDLYILLDFYSRYTARNHGVENALDALIKDISLPAGYRAFLLIYWAEAPSWIPRELAEGLLNEDMPEFIREALQRRLLHWPVSP